MNGAFLMGKQALCHQSPVSRLTRSIHRGPELPGSMQFSVTETGAVAGPYTYGKPFDRETKAEHLRRPHGTAPRLPFGKANLFLLRG